MWEGDAGRMVWTFLLVTATAFLIGLPFWLASLLYRRWFRPYKRRPGARGFEVTVAEQQKPGK